MDDRIDGRRAIAKAIGRSREWLEERVARAHDPLRLRRYREHHDWVARDVLVAWYERDVRRELLTKAGNHYAPPDAIVGRPDIADLIDMSERLLIVVLREPVPPPIEYDAAGKAWAYRGALLDYVNAHTRPAPARLVAMRTKKPLRIARPRVGCSST